MDNADIAAVFEEMADIMEILGEDPFRINSFRKAARVIADATSPLAELAEAGELEKLPGVGEGTARRIRELLATGKLADHEALRAKIPAGLTELLTIQGLGPKTVAKLWKQGKITSLDELRTAIEKNPETITDIEGMGAKKLELMKEAIAFAAAAGQRFRLDEAADVAEALTAVVAACEGAERVETAGSFRRRQETVGDIDVLCQADESRAEAIIAAFTSAERVTQVLAAGKTKGSVIVDGRMQADLRVVPAESFGAALQYFTGSKAHNIALREMAAKRKWKLNEYGLFDADGKPLAGSDEEGIYKAFGLAWIPPELREDRGEIAAAAEGKLPRLIEIDDIRGDLHMHTTASDGRNSIEEMIAACRALGYRYMAITDHSKSQIQANGLDAERLAEHVAAIRAAGEKHKDIVVLAGVEVDILKDGSLDFPDEVLAELDFVTASPHSALSQKSAEATKRLIRAIEDPHVDVIGHASGRLIGRRAGMEIDIAAVAAAAAANDTALEINAHPMRLDLRDVHVRAAVEAQAKLLICTDAHSLGGQNTDAHRPCCPRPSGQPSEEGDAPDVRKLSPDNDLANMPWGVATARRGWATAADVINTWPKAKLLKWLKR